MSTNVKNIEFANNLAWTYEYLKALRVELNSRPDRNALPLMPVDVRLELALYQLQSAVELLRRPDMDGIPLVFTPVRRTQ